MCVWAYNGLSEMQYIEKLLEEIHDCSHFSLMKIEDNISSGWIVHGLQWRPFTK